MSSGSSRLPPQLAKMSNTEIGLIVFGIVVLIVLVLLIVYFLNKKTPEKPKQVTNSTTFAQQNYDREQEQLKQQSALSSLNTPYFKTPNDLPY